MKKKRYFANDTEKAIYQRWLGMFERSFRGTDVCPSWCGDEGLNRFTKWSLENGFRKDLCLDRINALGDYSPDNCRWVDSQMNSRNSLKSVFLYYHGEIRALSALCKESKVSDSLLRYRIATGWDIDDALNVMPGGKRTKEKTINHTLPYEKAVGHCKDLL